MQDNKQQLEPDMEQQTCSKLGKEYIKAVYYHPGYLTSMQSSVQFSHSVMSDSLWPHELQHTRPPCPSPTPGVHSDSRPSSQWCHPAISSSGDPMDCRPPGSSVHGIFQARVLEWGAIAFSKSNWNMKQNVFSLLQYFKGNLSGCLIW